MNELTIGDKIYVSSKRAAEITGYAKDYVGQLCREGHVEAKMVGRSWYVLESSIREHRFGKQEQEKSSESVSQAPVAPEVSLPATWEPSVYTSETVTTIPKIVVVPKVEPVRQEISTEVVAEPALNEMQTAWKEWFETRGGPNVESPEESEEKEPEIANPVVEETVSLPIQKIEEPVVERETRHVEIKRVPEPVVTISPPIYRQAPHPVAKNRRRRSSAGSNVIVTALLVVFAGISIAIAAISTGYASQYLSDNPVVRFLGGTSTVSK